jgi:sugar lactone lactonase YvrE
LTTPNLVMPLDAPAASPIWDAATRTLLWVTAPSKVHRLNPTTGSHDILDLPQPVGAALPRAKGGLALHLRDGIGLADRDGTLTWLVYWAQPGQQPPGTAAADPTGRLWAISPPGLTSITPEGTARVVRREPSTSITWNPDGTTLYVATGNQVAAWDFDMETGTVTAQRPFCTPPNRAVSLCPAADGALWICGPSAVFRYHPDGTPDRTITIPDGQGTGCCLGGPAFTDLYITTDKGLYLLEDADEGLPATVFSG